MKKFKFIGVLVNFLCFTGGPLWAAGFGANTGQYNPYAGYSVGSQAAFVGENLGLQAGVLGLNALAQRAYKWGNGFQKPNKDTRGQFGPHPHSYVQQGTLARYAPRQQLKATPQATSNFSSRANISPAFVARSKEIEQLCAKWQQENPETFIKEKDEESYPELLEEAETLVEYRREVLVLLKNPHDPAVEGQLKYLSQEAYRTASKIDMIILKMVAQEVEANKNAIIKGVALSKKAQQGSQAASIFDKEWLEERQAYLKEAAFIWFKRFREEAPNGAIYSKSWDRSNPFLKQGYEAWVGAIEADTFIKEQFARY